MTSTFGAWDIFEENAYEAAVLAGVLEKPLLEQLREPLEKIRPMPAVFDHEYVKRINGPNLKPKGSKMEHAEMLMEDIRNFRESSGASRLVMIWCGSTEVFHKPAEVHATLKNFECGLKNSDPEISPSQIYAYAALKMRRAVRQWRAAPDQRIRRRCSSWRANAACRCAEKISRPARHS